MKIQQKQYSKLLEEYQELKTKILIKRLSKMIIILFWIAASITSIWLTAGFIKEPIINWCISFFIPFLAFWNIKAISTIWDKEVKNFPVPVYALLFITYIGIAGVNDWTMQTMLSQSAIENLPKSDAGRIESNQVNMLTEQLNKNKRQLEKTPTIISVQKNHSDSVKNIQRDKNEQIKNCQSRYKSRTRRNKCKRAEDKKESRKLSAENKNYQVLLSSLTGERERLIKLINRQSEELKNLMTNQTKAENKTNMKKQKLADSLKASPKYWAFSIFIGLIADLSLFIYFLESQASKVLIKRKKHLEQQLDTTETPPKNHRKTRRTPAEWQRKIIEEIEEMEFPASELTLRKASDYSDGILGIAAIRKIFRYCAQNGSLESYTDSANRTMYRYHELSEIEIPENVRQIREAA